MTGLRTSPFAAVLLALAACAGPAEERAELAAGRPALRRLEPPLESVPFERVAIHDGFWSPKLETVRTVTVQANLAKCEETGRIANFARAGGLEPGGHEGYLYNDSDVYKVLEGIAYVLALAPDPELEARADGIIARIAAAQQPDGYLNTHITLKHPDKRWENVRSWHELYCAGHLIEAGVAYVHATGKRALLDVGIRLADCIDRDFGPDARLDPPGHQELELALLKLAREVPEEDAARYRALAAFFLDQRGSSAGREPFGEYCQDHLPVREQREVAGHAVRAMYQYCAMADLAALTGDGGLLDALGDLWRDVVERKMYVTGGIGPSASNEGFTVPYDLPNDTAYAETCAAIGMAMWNHRLLLMSGEGRFADVLERELYNGLLSGLALAGDRFFYDNPLASRGGHHRVPWFDCSCCPTNLVRYLPALGERVYAVRGDALYVVLYAGSSAEVELEGGPLRVRQETEYPWSGAVVVHVDPPEPRELELRLRIPAWSEGRFHLRMEGERVEDVPVEDGFAVLRRTWRPGDSVELLLEMPPRRVRADPRVAANVGRAAIQRGPLVYCLEGADHGGRARNLVLPPDAPLEASFRPDLLGGVAVVKARGLERTADLEGNGRTERSGLLAVPYFAWDNRAPGEMVVWLPEDEALAEVPGEGDVLVQDGVRVSASHCYRNDTVAALNDGLLPRSSADDDLPRLTFWDHRGTSEWLQYVFPAPRTVSEASVYWFDDTGRGSCRAPASWRLLHRQEGAWRPVELLQGESYGTALDRANAVRFEPVETDALRLEVDLREGFSGGVLEWSAPALP